MMPAANQGVGMNMGFPDVCLTPAAPAPLPIPYPNIGMNAMAMPFVPNVMMSMAPAQNMGAKPLMTNGDNAGVAHPLCMQPGGTIMGNPRILVGGMPASHLCVPTYGNNFNNPVGSKLVPSVTNVMLGFRRNDARALHREAGRVRRLTDRTALVVLPLMSLRTGVWFATVLQRLRALGITSLVLDLRGNPGGSVPSAAHVATLLLGRGTDGLRLAIAQDRSTASAAELLTATLQDHGRARVFGERSYGKGRAALHACSLHALQPTGSCVLWTRHDGGAIERIGITPDVPCAGEDAVSMAHADLSPAPRNR